MKANLSIRSATARFALLPPRRRAGRRAFTLIEVLVYLGLAVLLLGFGYSAAYRCTDNSVALRRSTDDIVNALHAGERWRADVRAASGQMQVESGPGGQIFRIPCVRGEVVYRFVTNEVFRQVGGSPALRVLENVKVSAMQSDPRQNVVAWRWELELKPRAKISRVRPLFTFIAASSGSSAK